VASIDDLKGQTVAIDTAPFIYFIEQHPTFLSKVEAIFESAERGEIRAITSVLTLLEVLVHPIRNGRTDLADEYRRILLGSAAIRVIPVDAAVAEAAATLRATSNIKTPDSIQLATALVHGAHFFITGDAGMPFTSGLRILTPADLHYF